MEKSIVRISLMTDVLRLQDFKEKYSAYDPEAVIDEHGYTYQEHVQYLQEKIDCYAWAIDVLKKAEAENP